MVSEAWKADLNYIPRPVDPIAPVQRIEAELFLDGLKAKDAEAYNPENFRQPNAFTTFRVSWFPQKEIDHKRKVASSLAAAISNRTVDASLQ